LTFLNLVNGINPTAYAARQKIFRFPSAKIKFPEKSYSDNKNHVFLSVLDKMQKKCKKALTNEYLHCYNQSDNHMISLLTNHKKKNKVLNCFILNISDIMNEKGGAPNIKPIHLIENIL